MNTHNHIRSNFLKTISLYISLILLAIFLCGCCTPCHGSKKTDHAKLLPDYGVTATFSIVAVDPNTGVCGAAVASKYPAVGRIVPFVRPGVGAFCTQHWHNPDWSTQALDLLARGKLPEEVLAELLRDDARRDKRQLAIIDMQGRAANRNPANADWLRNTSAPTPTAATPASICMGRARPVQS